MDFELRFGLRPLFSEARQNLKRNEMVENLEGEIWKPVVGFEGKYEASNMGRIKSLNYNRKGYEWLLTNRLENLELVTCTQNNNHGSHKQRVAKANSKKVYQYDMDGTFVKEWDSTKACQEFGFNQSAVSACCRNTYCRRERNDYKGYIWSFKPPIEGGLYG